MGHGKGFSGTGNTKEGLFSKVFPQTCRKALNGLRLVALRLHLAA
jgi:hypothetical protein